MKLRKRLHWAAYRNYRRLGQWFCIKLIVHFKHTNTVLGTSIPNVKCLRLKAITMVNSYGQERSYRWDDKDLPHTGFWKPDTNPRKAAAEALEQRGL